MSQPSPVLINITLLASLKWSNFLSEALVPPKSVFSAGHKSTFSFIEWFFCCRGWSKAFQKKTTAPPALCTPIKTSLRGCTHGFAFKTDEHRRLQNCMLRTGLLICSNRKPLKSLNMSHKETVWFTNKTASNKAEPLHNTLIKSTI